MTNLQLYLAVGLPTLLLLLGQWLNFNATKDLRVSVEQRLLLIEADLREFYRAIGKIEALERKQS